MPMTLADIIEMAEMCAFNARSTLNPRTSEEVWKIALEYQRMAAELDGQQAEHRRASSNADRQGYHSGLEFSASPLKGV
jgi:hypothetical protein